MLIEKTISVDGRDYPVVISDEDDALLAAGAAGKTVIGIYREGVFGPGLDQCRYLVDSPESVTENLLERAVRRHEGLPWIIARTERLVIREFTDQDPLEAPSEDDGGGVFSDFGRRHTYILCQYAAAEMGIWAVVRKADGVIVGKCGIGGEFGYHIFPEFRGNGYAEEAARAVIAYARDVIGLTELSGWIRIGNLPSRHLAEKLGMRPGKKSSSGDCIQFYILL